jgi:DNA-binding NtrC family response regulator
MFDVATDSNQQQTILAVDDNTYTLRIVQHAVEQANFHVVSARAAAGARSGWRNPGAG